MRASIAVLLAAGFACSTTALSPSPAYAHGGVFRGPGGQVPPALRPPGDPQPPPPPPPTGGPPPETPPPTNGGPPTSGLPVPGKPPPVTPPTDPGVGTEPLGERRRPATISFDHWEFWWAHNDAEFVRVKDALYGMRVTDESPLWVLGRSKSNVSDALRPTEKEVREVVVPALLRVMDPKADVDPDVAGAAHVALAKVTSDPAHLALLRDAVADADRPAMVREAAAIALGLVRRGERRTTFDAYELDRMRRFCLETYEDEESPTRVRGFAMLSIGLLGDQPTAEPVAPRLVAYLKDRQRGEDLPVALLQALSLQPSGAVGAETLDLLVECVLRGRIGREDASEMVRAHAALAVGRLGWDVHVAPMLNALTLRNAQSMVRRSAAIALGQLGARVDGARRAEVASALVRAAESTSDSSTRNFAIMSIARLLEADVRAQRTDVLNEGRGRAVEFLARTAQSGAPVQRPYGALALGLVANAVGDRPTVETYGDLQVRAVAILREGLADGGRDASTRAAFAVSLGLARDAGSLGALVALVADRDADTTLRGHAAVAVGMVGGAGAGEARTLEGALRERSSEELRRQAAVGLALMHARQAVDVLVAELADPDASDGVKGQVVAALGAIGDQRAIAPLSALVEDAKASVPTRALACAGLGLVGDLEVVPTLSLLSKDQNYRASPDVLTEVLTIL
jgi:HEAT repeat protein